MSRLKRKLTDGLVRASTVRHRLVGLALLRVVIGFVTVLYCLADYGNRRFLWGPDSYVSPEVARGFLPSHWSFSLFLASDSPAYFEVLFHLVIVSSIAFMVFGGKTLTVVQAVLLWSLHNRNQDVLEGGDNLTQIAIIFMCFCTTNAYLAPGAARRRRRLHVSPAPSAGTLLHNIAAFLIVFQICVLYFVAGYWKVTGSMWQNGTAMYYISRITAFSMYGSVAHLFSSPYLGTVICYVTIVIELAFPFAVLSTRPWLRKANILAIEGMHLGIMVFMGLVCFGLIMLGADSVCLRDADYRAMASRLRARRPRTSARASLPAQLVREPADVASPG